MAEDERKRIPASEILAKIEKGEAIEYDNVIIEGDLDISLLDLPIERVERTDFRKDIGLKDDVELVRSSIRITNSAIKGNLNFSNVIIKEDADFSRSTFNGDAYFLVSTFNGNADFSGSTFNGNADFSGSTFNGDAYFSGSTFNGDAYFLVSTFNGDADFIRSTFCGDADFSRSTFKGHAHFIESEFRRGAYFSESTFDKETVEETYGDNDFCYSTFSGDVEFRGSAFKGNTHFEPCSFNGEILDFRDTKFNKLEDQEFPCRRAKQLAQNLGDKDEADNYYYREMVGRRVRIQNESIKPWTISSPINYTVQPNTTIGGPIIKVGKYLRYNILETVVFQWIFGYGVHLGRLCGFWGAFVLIFAILYSVGGGISNSTTNTPLNVLGYPWFHITIGSISNSTPSSTLTFLDYLWISITIAITPGFAGYKPTHGIYQIVAGVEAILGMFMWSALIATFSRKYMR